MRTLLLCYLALLAYPALAQPDHDRPGAFVIGEAVSAYDLDPASTSASIDFRILRGMHETLLLLGDDGMTLEPGAAESWEVSDDGLTYTFHLREDARWSNGDPVTANDFVMGWFRALLPDTGGAYAALLFPIDGAIEFRDWRIAPLREVWNGGEEVPYEDCVRGFEEALARFDREVGIEALDESTFRVTLARPTPHFPYLVTMLTFAPFPSEHFDEWLFFYKDGSGRIDPAYFVDPDRLITNGPYRLVRFTEGEELRLTANEHYWNANAVQSARIIHRYYEGPEALLEAYERGEVDWATSVYLESAEELVASGREDVHLLASVGTYYFEFNCRLEVNGEPNPFADRDLRRALAHAFDREAVAELVGFGAEPIGTFVPPGTMPGYEPPEEAVAEYDLSEAERLLAQAGYEDLSILGEFSILVNGDGRFSANPSIARIISDRIVLLGADTKIEAIEFHEYLRRSKLGDFQLRRAGWFADYNDPTTFLEMFLSGSSNNDAGYESEVFDELMASAASELDQEKRMAILREAEALLLEDAVIVPLYQYVSMSLYDPARVRVPLNAWSYTRLEHLERLAD